jgi:hypothetical protein
MIESNNCTICSGFQTNSRWMAGRKILLVQSSDRDRDAFGTKAHWTDLLPKS